MNLIVEYDTGYLNAKSELLSLLRDMGDSKADSVLLVPSWFGIKTTLHPRRIIEDLKELVFKDPETLKYVKKIVPVDEWCVIGDILMIIKEDIKASVGTSLYRVDVIVHKGDSDELVSKIQQTIGGRPAEDFAEKIVRVDIFDTHASVSLLKPVDVFSR